MSELTTTDIYKVATKNPNIRFNLGNGEITVCDLWRYSLDKLDQLYKDLHTELNSTPNVSLFDNKTFNNEILELKIAIVADVFKTKFDELQALRNKEANLAKAKLIREKLYDKEIEDLVALDAETLFNRLKDLDP